MAFFGKRNLELVEFLDEILGWRNELVMVADAKNCKRLYSNAAAENKYSGGDSFKKCTSGFSRDFENLCKYCPANQSLQNPEQSVYEAHDKDGVSYSVEAKKIRLPDGGDGVMLVMTDTTKSKQMEEHLYSLAYIDQLTKVPNRQKLTEDFKQLSRQIGTKELAGALAIFDLDHFKTINDTYGHNAGDMMLQRLADHINLIPALNNKIYRLGGDEFVLLCYEQTDPDMSLTDYVELYTNILSETLKEYTIPNIEEFCTLSIGVSLFPQHGTTMHELLRKSDIALYESKEKGRNRITFFEGKYEKAKKLKDLYINIQPVISAGGKTYGYELVDNSNENDSSRKSAEETVNLTDLNRALDALNFDDIRGSVRYFIQYTEQLLNPLVLSSFSADKFIVELPVASGITKGDLNKIKELNKFNYRIALTGVRSSSITKELLDHVDFCKFDSSDRDKTMQTHIISNSSRCTFIATAVNTKADYDHAKSMGFNLFQGFHFNEPVVETRMKELDPIQANYFRLLQLTSTEDFVDFKEISDVIASDVSLTYKLLKLLNSAVVGLRNVSSIPMAVAYLGEDGLKQWISLLALRGVADDKPHELVRASLVRAKFGELLSPHFKNRKASKHIFLLGMLSLLHVAMDTTRELLLEEIPVADEIRDSLLTKTGPYSAILQFFEDYEYGNWASVTLFAEDNHIDSQTINDCYFRAVKWYGDLISTAPPS